MKIINFKSVKNIKAPIVDLILNNSNQKKTMGA